MKIVNVTSTWQYKLKRVIKYLVVWSLAMVFFGFVDALIAHWIKDAYYKFNDFGIAVYGAMVYRLLSTWNYE